jgi:hypothetical protein
MLAVATDANLRHARVAGGKERCVPGVQALVRERVVAALDRVVHDVQQAFHVARRARPILPAHAQPPCDRTAHGCQVQSFALDGRGGQRILAPGLRSQFQALFEAQGRQLAFDQALRTPHLGQDLADTNAVVPKIGPVRVLPDVCGCAGFHALRWR